MKEEKDIFNKITSKAKSLKLTGKERSVLFSRVDSYVKKNPINSAKSARKPKNEIQWFSYIFGNYSSAVSFALVVFIVLGGGTSLAAENSLPGNPLYPVKVNVNEGIKSFFVNAADKVNFESDRAALRVGEIEKLAKKGKLSFEAETQAQLYFDAHVAKVESSIQKYRDNGELKKAFEASSRLELSLKASEESLYMLNDGQSHKISNALQSTIQSSSLAREQVEQIIADSSEDSDDVRVIAETRLFAVKMLVGGLNKNFNSKASDSVNSVNSVNTDVASMKASQDVPVPTQVNKAMSESEIVSDEISDEDISSWLERSNALTAEGEVKMKQGFYKEAHTLFKKAYDVAEEGKILKQLRESGDVNLNDLE